MNNQPQTPETPETLLFGNSPIRIATFEPVGVPHFSLEDICKAMSWSHDYAAAKVDSIYFPEHGKRTATEDTDQGALDLTVLTPVGVFYLTDIIDAPKGQRVSASAKREARRLCPEAPEGDPAMFLTISPGNRRPPRPMKYSGWRSEWYALWDASSGTGAYDPVRERYELRQWALDEERMAMLRAQRAEQEAA